MKTLRELEAAVSQLSDDELATFREWFAKFDAEQQFEAKQWDRRFEQDVATGRLDNLAAKALEHLKQGRCTDL